MDIKTFFKILATLEIYSKAIVSLVLSAGLFKIKKLKKVEAQYNNKAAISQKNAVLYAGVVSRI